MTHFINVISVITEQIFCWQNQNSTYVHIFVILCIIFCSSDRFDVYTVLQHGQLRYYRLKIVLEIFFMYILMNFYNPSHQFCGFSKILIDTDIPFFDYRKLNICSTVVWSFCLLINLSTLVFKFSYETYTYQYFFSKIWSLFNAP